MKRAAEIFVFGERAVGSPFVEKIWRTRSEPFDSFISVAATHWEIVVTRQDGRTSLTVRGPETKSTTSPIPENAEFLGIQFRLGTFMPGLPLGQLVDGSTNLPEAAHESFWLNGSAWEVPDFDNADVFVNTLVREGLLVRDPAVDAVLRDDVRDLSARSIHRRVLRATGLTQGAIRQIERAQKAVDLLSRGVPILETVWQAGYADQPHLTRSLKRFAGQTPAQIVRSITAEP